MTEEELAALKAEQEAADAANASKEADEKAKEGETPDDKSKKKTTVSDAEAKAIKELMKWKERAREAENAAKELADKYGNIDLEAAKEALRQAEEAENKELERKGEYDRLLAKQREAAESQINQERKAREEAERRIAELAKTIDDLSLGNAFANSKFIQENVALTPNKTRALYSSHFDIQDGKIIAYDAPKGAANRTPIVDASGEPVPFDEAMAAIINSDPDKDYLIKVNQKPGAGSKPSVNQNGDSKPRFDSTLDKLAAGVKNPKNFGHMRQ